MRDTAKAAELKHPELVTSTALRKYISTVAQIINLEKGELEWLANHLGHDLEVHKSFYRLHESTVELSKVSRLLLAVDSGCTAKYSGKPLAEVNMLQSANSDAERESDSDDDDDDHGDDVEPCNSDIGEADDIDESLAASPVKVTLANRKQRLIVQGDVIDSEFDDVEGNDAVAKDKSKSKRKIKGPPAAGLLHIDTTFRKRKPCNDPDYTPNGHKSQQPSALVPKRKRLLVVDNDDIDDSDDVEGNDAVAKDKSKSKRKIKGPPAAGLLQIETTVRKRQPSSDSDYTPNDNKSDKGRKRKCCPTVRKAWTSAELHLVMHAFRKNLADGSAPGYSMIEQLQKKYPSVLHSRSREQIRARVWHEIKKRKKTQNHASAVCSEACFSKECY